MLDDFMPIYVALGLHLALVIVSGRAMRPLVAVLLATSAYYSLLGPLYWSALRDGEFLGVYWADQLPRAAGYIAYGSLGFALSGVLWWTLLERLDRPAPGLAGFDEAAQAPQAGTWGASTALWRVLFVTGSLAALMVLASVSAGRFSADSGQRTSLVAYQFSDLLIPALLFLIAARGFDRLTIVLTVLFIGFVSVLGLRYKLLLVFFPVIMMYTMPVRGKRRVPLVNAFALMLAMVIGFSALTMTRAKFSGVNLDALAGASFEEMLYGFFAESNTIFGLMGTIREGVDLESHIGLDPVRDALLELVPRAILPDRVTGAYLQVPLEKLLVGDEALRSGTAFPYIGELLLMGGLSALVIGNLILGLVYALIARSLRRLSSQLESVENAGHGLIAVYFGYYYFSRGYLPQTFKAFLFVVIPYVMLAAATRYAARRRRHVVHGHA